MKNLTLRRSGNKIVLGLAAAECGGHKDIGWLEVWTDTSDEGWTGIWLTRIQCRKLAKQLLDLADYRGRKL